jgi:hypothetical protein
VVACLRRRDQLGVATTIDERGLLADGPTSAQRARTGHVWQPVPGFAAAGARSARLSAAGSSSRDRPRRSAERSLRDRPRLDAVEVLRADAHRRVARLAPPEERVAQELLAVLVARLAGLEVDDLDPSPVSCTRSSTPRNGSFGCVSFTSERARFCLRSDFTSAGVSAARSAACEATCPSGLYCSRNMRTARFASSSPLARSRNAGPGLGCAVKPLLPLGDGAREAREEVCVGQRRRELRGAERGLPR